MDTDDLSIEAYKGILGEAEKFNHDLTLQFGLITSDCLNEDEFLDRALELIEEFKSYQSEDLADIFYDKIPDLKSFKITLEIISDNIFKLKRL